MSQEIVPQTADTVIEESVPSSAQTDPNDNAGESGSAPELGQVAVEPDVADAAGGASVAAVVEPPAESKVVQELKSQRLKRQQAEREAAYWQGVAQGGRGIPGGPGEQSRQDPVTPVSIAPKLADFATYEEYESARDDFVIRKAKEEVVKELRTTDTKTQEQAVHETFMARIQKASEMDPELPSIIEDMSLPISDAMAVAVKESELAPQLLRYLNDNRDVARKLFGMSPISSAREIGKIETQLAAKAKTAPPRKVTQAPDPISTIAPVGGAMDIDPERESIADFMRRRNAR